jgi:hypothetical protein
MSIWEEPFVCVCACVFVSLLGPVSRRLGDVGGVLLGKSLILFWMRTCQAYRFLIHYRYNQLSWWCNTATVIYFETEY